MNSRRVKFASGRKVRSQRYSEAAVRSEGLQLRCHTCSAFPRLAQRILDPRTGKAFRLYRCECGDTVWKSSPLTIVGTPRIITSFGSRRMFKQVQRILLEIPERGQVNLGTVGTLACV